MKQSEERLPAIHKDGGIGRKDGGVVKFGSLALAVVAGSLFTLTMGCGKNDENASATEPSAPTETTPQPVAEGSAVSPDESKTMSDDVIVTVDGKSLNRSMADAMMQEMMQRQGVPPQMLQQLLQQMGPQLEQQVIDQFVGRTLVENAATKLAAPVADDVIEKSLAQIKETLPPEMTLEQALAGQGMDLAALRENVIANERMRMLYESKTTEVAAVTDTQVDEFYTGNPKNFTEEASVSASHVLISCDEGADTNAHATAKAEADAVFAELSGGADFAAVALAKSSCPSKDKGGSLGTFGRGQMVGEFEEAAFAQEIGKVGDVVKTKFGYHVIKVTERSEGGVKALEDVRGDIRTHLEGQAKGKVFDAYVQTLRDGAEIVYAKPPAAAPAAPEPTILTP